VGVGLALLDAAALAEGMVADDPVLVSLSEAGCFESMPDQQAIFVNSEEIQRAILRPVSGVSEPGPTILTNVAVAAGRS
jgi:hypothetical protein